jgi:signal peptidase I
MLAAVLVALTFRWAVGEPYSIPSGSMEPTLHGDARFLRGDRVFVNKWAFGLRIPFTNIRLWRAGEPKRWDIVVFYAVEKDAEHPILIKRVVGLPGERVHIADGKVHINGEPLELPKGMPPVEYTDDGRYGILDEDGYCIVPEDCYMVLGDNSDSSKDSRFFGWVPHDNMVGRAACVWWPFSHWHDLTGFSNTWWWRGLVAALLGYLVWQTIGWRVWRRLMA